MQIGTTTIKIVVTAQNGATKTYKVHVTRTAKISSTHPKLLSLRGVVPEVTDTTPVRVDGATYLLLSVKKRSDGTIPVVEVSSNLVDWFSGPKHTTSLIDDAVMLRVRDNTPTTPSSKRYIRVRWR